MSVSHVEFYPEAAFGGFTDADGTITFYARVNSLLRPDFTVVDFGCGRGRYSEDPVTFRRDLSRLQGKVARVIGLDVDPAAAANPRLDDFRPLEPGHPWPVPDASADLVLCDQVMEHLPAPAVFFAEARRVLRSGGYLCIRTPNANSYVGLASRLIPNHLHARVLSRAQPRRKEEDVFPTLYRCNTIGALRRMMDAHGFRAAVYGYEAEPQYLAFSRLAYRVGVWVQKFAPGWLRPSIFAFGQLQ